MNASVLESPARLRSKLQPVGRRVPIESPHADPTVRIFWLFVGAHVALWTAATTLTQPNRPLDMIEMLFWGRGWQWGYAKHPPLPAWIAQGVFQLAAGADWAHYLVAQLAIAACFWSAWKVAREFFNPWAALCAATLLEGCSYYNFMAADLNNLIILQPCWALATLCLYRAIKTEQLRYWAATGVWLGLGMLTKYDMATLALAFVALPLVNARARAMLRTAGPYLTIAVSLLVFLPHVVWMIDNDYSTIRYVFFRAGQPQSWLAHITHPGEFFLSQVLALLPLAALAWPLYRRGGPRDGRPEGADKMDRDFLLLACFGPIAFDLLVSMVTGFKAQSMWGSPLWTFIGVVVLRYAGAAVNVGTYRSVVRRCAWLGGAIALVLVVKNVGLPYLAGKPTRMHFPGPQLAEVVQLAWQHESDQPLAVVAGNWWPATSAGVHLAGHVEVYDFFHPGLSPWVNDERLRDQGGVIVWEADLHPELADEVRERFSAARILPPVAIDWQTGARIPPAIFGLAIVLPPPEQMGDEPR